MASLEAKKSKISARKDEDDIMILSGEEAVETLLHFIEGAAISQRREAEDTQRLDEWGIELLDREEEQRRA